MLKAYRSEHTILDVIILLSYILLMYMSRYTLVLILL